MLHKVLSSSFKNIYKDSRWKDENAHFRTRRLQQHSAHIYRETTCGGILGKITIIIMHHLHTHTQKKKNAHMILKNNGTIYDVLYVAGKCRL